MIVTFLIPDHQIIYVSYNHLLNLENEIKVNSEFNMS